MVIKFEDLQQADLIKGEIYLGGTNGNQSDEVLSKIFKVGNAGGFRYRGSIPDKLSLLVLFSSNEHSLWRDGFDSDKYYVYYGDNKSYLKDVKETKKQGNSILEKFFEYTYIGKRELVPPIFVVEKVKGRDLKLVGLAVPGGENLGANEALELIEQRDEEGNVFQNYKARFTILNDNIIDSRWLDDIEQGEASTSEYAPVNWVGWVNNQSYDGISKTPETNREMTEEEMQKSAELLAYFIARFGEDNYDKLIYKNLHGITVFVKNYLELTKGRFLKTIESYIEILNDRNAKLMKNPPRYIYSILTEYNGMNKLALIESINRMIVNVIENRHDMSIPIILGQEISDSVVNEYTTAATGQLAEKLFYEWYVGGKIKELHNYKGIDLEDTRLTNNGYDFSMGSFPNYLFEIKGLRASKGSVRFTQNEWAKASEFLDRYFLVFIYDLDKEPKYKIVRNPYSTLKANVQEMYVKQVNWHIKSSDIVSSIEETY